MTRTDPVSTFLFTVRVRVLDTSYVDSYFDLTNLAAANDDQALGMAIQLSTECFGHSFEKIACVVRKRQPLIDC